MKPFEANARAWLDEVGARRPSPQTPRHHEVAELVSKGKTNLKSPSGWYLLSTAQNHVQHILTKLAFSNRSQIAVWFTAGR